MRRCTSTASEIAVVSDIHYDIRDHFRRHDLDRYVDAYVLSFEHGCQKPDAEMFTLALDALGVTADRALMVGDTPVARRRRGAGRHRRPTSSPGPFQPGRTGPRGLDAVLRLVGIAGLGVAPDDRGFPRVEVQRAARRVRRRGRGSSRSGSRRCRRRGRRPLRRSSHDDGHSAKLAGPGLFLIASLTLVLLLTMLFGAGLNVAIERAAFRPFRGRSKLAPLIATLGLSFVLYQLALIWRTTLPSWIPGDHRSVPGLPEVPLDHIPPIIQCRPGSTARPEFGHHLSLCRPLCNVGRRGRRAGSECVHAAHSHGQVISGGVPAPANRARYLAASTWIEPSRMPSRSAARWRARRPLSLPCTTPARSGSTARRVACWPSWPPSWAGWEARAARWRAASCWA